MGTEREREREEEEEEEEEKCCGRGSLMPSAPTQADRA